MCSVMEIANNREVINIDGGFKPVRTTASR
jgi:hypothetical protein